MALWLWLPLLALALAPPLAPPPALAVSIGQTAGSSPSPGSPGDVASAATPTIVPMTIPLPDPVFWDPSTSRENYVVVEQGGSLHLIRAKTGQVIGRFERKTHGEGIPLGLQLPEQIRKMAGDAPSLPPVRGWPFHPGGAVERTPLLVDLDGDCIAEVLFATPDGWLWALGPDALVLAGWPVPLGAACDAALGAADLDRDGYPEVLAGDVEGKVHALRRDGTSLEGWPARVPGTTALPAISGAVTAADLDGDGWTEVIVTQAAGRVCVLLSDGQAAAGWPVSTAAGDDPPNAGTIFSRPAIGDLDGDSRLEIVAGANNYRAHAWDLHGRPLRGWPRLFENRGRAGYADPVLADLDSDRLPEVILATDRGFSGPSRLYVLDRKGQDLAGWPVDLPEACNSGVAVGDLDGDGQPELVAATIGSSAWVLAWDRHGKQLAGFPVGLAEMSFNASPILADVNGDRAADILVSSLRTRFDPAAAVVALDRRGVMIPPFPLRLDGYEVVAGGPSVADLDADGHVELVLPTELEGRVFAWHLPSSGGDASAPWPRPGFDESNTGLYRPGRRGLALASPGASAAPGPSSPSPMAPPSPDFVGPPRDLGYSTLQSVSFLLEDDSPTRLIVRDVRGREMRRILDTTLPPGAYTIRWDGKDGAGKEQPPGVYFYELETGAKRVSGQFLLLK